MAHEQQGRRSLLSVKQFSQVHPAFTQGSLRHLIFMSKERRTSRGMVAGNGLTAALVRVGRRVLIDEDKFFAWLDAQPANTARVTESACADSVENLCEDRPGPFEDLKWVG